MKTKKGFTLIEVLITITIIGILSTLTIFSYKNYVTVCNEATTKQELSQLAQVFEIGLINGEFTHSNSAIDYSSLQDIYESITGYDLPFTDEEVSYENYTLTFTKRDVTYNYDF